MNDKRRGTTTVLVLVALALLVAVVLVGCGTSATTTTTAQPATTTTVAGPTTTGASGPTGATPAKIEVALSGDQSVPAVQTSASGTAIIMIEGGPNGFNISFELDVTNIVDVTAAHIHLGAAGTNGEVIVPLFTGPQKSGSFTGVLAKGAITQADLTGSMQGKTFADLAAAVLSGQTYVNVHTAANPKGEIRGQIVVPGAGGAVTTTPASAVTTTTAGAATTTSTAGGY
jgi:CHRD domain